MLKLFFNYLEIFIKKKKKKYLFIHFINKTLRNKEKDNAQYSTRAVSTEIISDTPYENKLLFSLPLHLSLCSLSTPSLSKD